MIVWVVGGGGEGREEERLVVKKVVNRGGGGHCKHRNKYYKCNHKLIKKPNFQFQPNREVVINDVTLNLKLSTKTS